MLVEKLTEILSRFDDENDIVCRDVFRLFPASRKVGLHLLRGLVDEAFKQLERLRLIPEDGQSSDLKSLQILLRKCFVLFHDLENVLELEEESKELFDSWERIEMIDFLIEKQDEIYECLKKGNLISLK